MPDFTITLSAKAVQKLQAIVQRHNDQNGTNLTVKEWVVLHLKELAITDELSTAITAIQQQHEADAQEAFDIAVRAERDRLLQEL